MTARQQEPYRIIVIDDTESIHEDFRKTLGGRSMQDAEAADDLAQQEAALFGDATEVQRPIDYEIDSAMQGEQGKEMVRRAAQEGRPYAVAFVDMRMPPGWDGLQTVEHLWREDQGLQVVICTAYSDYSWKQIIQRLGVSDKLLILKKPFESVEVSQIAMALCEKWAMTRTASLKLDELESLVERRTAELRFAATHDKLTGLANREYLVQRLRETITRCDRGLYAVLCLDFDRFKLVNDTYGHDVGDKLLQKIAERIRHVLPDSPDALSARMGGDEFVVILDRLADAGDAKAAADRLLHALREPYLLDHNEVCITASIGITTSETDYCQPQDVLRHADIAMYRAKANGRNGLAMFDRTMHDQIISRINMEQRLRRAVQENGLTIHYQPILRTSDGQLVGMEALCRLEGENEQMIAPEDFIPIAEEVGLIHPIGEFVLRTGLTQLRKWQLSNPRFADLHLNVNLSKRQLIDPGIVSRIASLIKQAGVQPRCLVLELTESTIMDEPEFFAARLKELKHLGVRFAMDDFGTGQSSLTCLHKFPIDVLKIDRSFIHSVSSNLEYAAIVQAIVTLAGNLGMQVVAEGIETNPQLVLVQALDCYAAQGFLFSQPEDGAYWDRNLLSFGHLSSNMSAA